MEVFLMGAIAMACWVAGLFFLRFWRDTGDRLFGIFCVAFWLLSVSRIGLAFSKVPSEGEGETNWYWVRLAAFVLILLAIADKNRRRL